MHRQIEAVFDNLDRTLVERIEVVCNVAQDQFGARWNTTYLQPDLSGRRELPEDVLNDLGRILRKRCPSEECVFDSASGGSRCRRSRCIRRMSRGMDGK